MQLKIIKSPLQETYFTEYRVNEIEYVINEVSIKLARCNSGVNEIGGVKIMYPD